MIGMLRLFAFDILPERDVLSLTIRCVVFFDTPLTILPPLSTINLSKSLLLNPDTHTTCPKHLPPSTTECLTGSMTGMPVSFKNSTNLG